MLRTLSLSSGRNNLLETLSDDDRALLAPDLHETELSKGMVLERPDQPIPKVCFPLSGVGSIMAIGAKGRRVESGLFGSDGMSGGTIVVESDLSPHETLMQVGGRGMCLSSDALRTAMEQSPSLRRHLLRFIHVLSVQIAQTALCNAQAKLEERLARWLLMCHDRIKGDELMLTHEYLAIMLGVRRAGVTVGIHMLEGKGLIRGQRGCVVVLDREGLVKEAKHSYGVPEREYVRLIGSAEDRPTDH